MSEIIPNVYEFIAGQPNWRRAINDVKHGWARRKLWTNMAIRGFNNRYKGAAIGGLWLFITTAMTVTGLGVLHGVLFGRPMHIHLPYVAAAMVAWSMSSSFINGGSDLFVSNAKTFKEFPLPLSLFAFRFTVTQLINVFFRVLVLAIVLLIFHTTLHWYALLSIIGFVMLVWIGFWTSIAFGVINAKYRDFGQMVSAGLSFMFFMTPIIWPVERLGQYAVWVNLNPFYHFIEIFRGPILGHGDLGLHFLVAGVFAVLAPLLAFYLYGRYSHRLPYWC